MKLIIARLRAPNFGDELNGWLWPRLLPGLFDEDESTRFMGIGSIISHRFDGGGRKIVCGTAFVPEYGRLPDLRAGDWTFYFVRGPHTARALGLDPRLAQGDPAILIRTLIDPLGPRGQAVSFMPHWESLDWGYWSRVCALAGVRLIDPRWPVQRVLDDILASRLVLCEAMHGAIVADALRVPWVPLLPLEPRHRAKWRDWSDVLDLAYQPRGLAPSSLTEWLPHLTRRLELLGAARDVMSSWPMTPVRAVTIRLAAESLRRAAAAPGLLSDEASIARATDRMLETLEIVRRDAREGRI